MDSVQKTVALADKALASISKSFNDDGEDLISLARSIDNTCITANGSNENIRMLDESKSLNTNNPFMTAKQALSRIANQKSTSQQQNFGSSNSYNPSMQARKLLGAKRRFVDPKNSNETSSVGYRDEGRDINTEFR